MGERRAVTRDAAESLAIQALTFIADEPERLGRFLATTGIGPRHLRAAARESGFLAAVLDHILSHDTLILEFAAHAGIDPADVGRARAAIDDQAWERDTP
jgi:hypothetical protein